MPLSQGQNISSGPCLMGSKKGIALKIGLEHYEKLKSV